MSINKRIGTICYVHIMEYSILVKTNYSYRIHDYDFLIKKGRLQIYRA